MANDWLKIKVDGTSSWGTTASGPSGTTGITISASSCDETIARSATIVFRAGSLTKRLKVTQGIASSPKVQIVPDLMVIGVNQTSTINLVVSNVDELTGWKWRVTQNGTTTGVQVVYNNVTRTGSFSGTSTTATITVKNVSATSGNLTLVAELLSSDDNVLSTDSKSFVLTQSQNPDPVITLRYSGSEILFHSGSTETILVSITNLSSAVDRYEWTVSYTDVLTGIEIDPSSGNTNNVQVRLTNNTRQSGGTGVSGRLHVFFKDGTDKYIASNSISITFLPPDYNFRIYVDTQPSNILNYGSSTTITFHVEDTNGHGTQITANDLSWSFSCNENWMNQQVSRSPSQGDFINNVYSGTSTIENTSILWGTTSVTFTLYLLKNGTVIDYINGQTSLDRYINNITVNPRPILTLIEPQPGAGGNVNSYECDWRGITVPVKFISNMAWQASFDAQKGFSIESGGSSGPAGSSSSDIITLMIRTPRNTSTALTIQDMFRVQQSGGAQRYIGFDVNPKEALYIRLMQSTEHYYLDGDINNRAEVIPISANVNTFTVVYDPSRPNWLSATTEYQQTTYGNYVLVLQTLEENTGSTRPQNGFIALTLQTTDDNGTPDDTNDDEIISSNEIKISQSRKTQDIVTIFVDGVAVWTNDGQGGEARTLFQAATEGYTTENSGKVITFERQTPGGATVRQCAFGIGDAGNGYLKRWIEASGNNEGHWGNVTDYPFSNTKALLLINENTRTTTAETIVKIYEDTNATTLIWEGVWWQAPYDISNMDRFTVTWNTEGKVYFDINITIGTDRLQPSTKFHIQYYDTETSSSPRESFEVTVSNSVMAPGDNFQIEHPDSRTEEGWTPNRRNGYFVFKFNHTATERIYFGSGTATGSIHVS